MTDLLQFITDVSNLKRVRTGIRSDHREPVLSDIGLRQVQDSGFWPSCTGFVIVDTLGFIRRKRDLSKQHVTPSVSSAPSSGRILNKELGRR